EAEDLHEPRRYQRRTEDHEDDPPANDAEVEDVVLGRVVDLVVQDTDQAGEEREDADQDHQDRGKPREPDYKTALTGHRSPNPPFHNREPAIHGDIRPRYLATCASSQNIARASCPKRCIPGSYPLR